MPPLKVSNVKFFYDLGDLENNVKVKLVTCKKAFVIMHLGNKYQVCTCMVIDL